MLYTRVPRLFADLAVAHGDVRYARLLRSLARVKLLILDDWGPEQGNRLKFRVTRGRKPESVAVL